ncbi:nuclear pore complex protein-like protein [uncultured phage cr19_1]|uniref:nuclear pore complex protein-like protein n=1 Tax=uncultured phage cr19_1 TaxID=2986420 RepID=UPI001C7627FD|nr:nuclear pore complex protein-like protein [uncultured phage cr19_1]
MQANRYDRAAEAPIMNTYVPINFGELYRIGLAQRQAVEQAANEFTNTVSKFGEFQSPSAVDTLRYYENSLGKIRDLIDEAATNPDAMKDANFRARLNSRIANLDYATLSNLKQSREGMLARQKANLELMIKGMYNPLWHDVDFTNYNTVDSGIFNDVAPLAYKSEVDLVRPYVDNLKASFMGVKDGWIHQGVSTDRTDYEIQRNLSSIQNTPEYQKHLEVLLRQGLSRQNAEEQLNRTLITAGREFAYDQAERDPMAVALARRAGAGSQQNRLLNLTDQLELTARDTFASALKDAPTVQDARKKLNDMFTLSAKTNNSLNSAINDVIGTLSSGIGAEANEVLTAQGTQTGKMTSQGWRVGNSSSEFLLRKRLAENLMDRKIGSSSKLQDDFEKGQFKNFLVAGTPNITTDGSNIFHNKYIFIPKSEIDKGKYTARDLAEVQGDWVNLDEDQVRVTESTNDYGETRTSINTALKQGTYLRIPVSTVVPRRGLEAVENDALHAKSRNIGQDIRDVMQAQSESNRLF